MPADPVPVEPVPVMPVLVQPVPVDPVPADPVPVDPVPADPVPDAPKPETPKPEPVGAEPGGASADQARPRRRFRRPRAAQRPETRAARADAGPDADAIQDEDGDGPAEDAATTASRTTVHEPGAPEAARPPRTPIYARLLRLRHIQPNGWQRATLGEGMALLGGVLALADLASAWTVVVLPASVAVVVKSHDLLAGVLASPGPPDPATAGPGVADRPLKD